jgi:hypothetical protein
VTTIRYHLEGAALALVALVAVPANAQDDYEGDEPGECTDRADNDRDGKFDCDDDGCAGSPDCPEETPPDSAPADEPASTPEAEVILEVDEDLRSEEGFVFPSPTALADYRSRRVGLRTTEDEKTIAWGVGGVVGFGGAGMVSAHRSAEIRLLRVDGTGATYATDAEFMRRIGQRDWHRRYLAHRQAQLRPEVTREAVGWAAAAASAFGAGLIGFATLRQADWAHYQDDPRSFFDYAPDPAPYELALSRDQVGKRCDAEWFGWSARCGVSNPLPVFGLVVSIPFIVAAVTSKKRVSRRHDPTLLPDHLLDHIDFHNRALATELGAYPDTVGESREPLSPADAATDVLQTERDSEAD